jgi:hypothetical protein
MRSEKAEKMLALIEERLASYSVEEVVERLHSYGGGGPTVDEFLASLDLLTPRPTLSEPCINDYSDLVKLTVAAKAAHPGEPWHYQEQSDVYTHIVRVNNPALNNSMIVTQLSQRSDGVSEAVARYIAAVNPDAILAMLADIASVHAQLATSQKALEEANQAYYRLNEHNNETERHLDDAVALLIDISKSGQAHRECSDKESETGERITALADYIAQFQPDTYAPASDELSGDDDWRMNPCKQGHRDVGASGGAAYCNQCHEQITADSTQEAFEQWNASHPVVPA